MVAEWQDLPFECVLAEPVRNGIYKPKEFHGRGAKIVNMGELFAYPRLRSVPMKLVQLSEAESMRSLLKIGDLLFARRSLVADGAGKCSVVLDADDLTTFESSIIRARPNPQKADSLYLFYFFNSPLGLHRLDSIRRHVAVAGITGSDLARLNIPIPPVPTQRAIAHILGTLDDKIELNHRMNETLEAMARAVFQSWFVDFDPVKAKAEGRETGLPPTVDNLFPTAMELSSIGKIPSGWKVLTIADLCEVVGGSTPRTDEPSFWEQGTHHWATPKDLSTLAAPVLLHTERRITEEGLAQIGSGLRAKGTVLLSSRAPIGYLAVAEVHVAINQGFIAMTPRAGVSNLFVLFWAESALDEIISRANGSTFLEISKANFRPIPVTSPSVALMDSFDRQVRPMYARIVHNLRHSLVLVTLRDALLPKLISGELRVKDAERGVEAVV